MPEEAAAEEGEGGDMNAEGTMNGDVRMNTLRSDLGHMPTSSDASVSMPDAGEPDTYSTMNGARATPASKAAAAAKTAAVMRKGPDEEENDEMPPTEHTRTALIKSMLTAGDIGLQTSDEQKAHLTVKDMREDNSIEMADMSHAHTMPASALPTMVSTAGSRTEMAVTMGMQNLAQTQTQAQAEVGGYMDAGDLNEGDIGGQMNAAPSSGLDMMGAIAQIELPDEAPASPSTLMAGLKATQAPSGQYSDDKQVLAQFSGHQYSQGPPMPPPGTASPLMPMTPIMNGTEPIQVPLPMHPYGVPYFHRDPFMPLQTPYYHIPAFDNPQKNPALTPYYNPYVNPPPPIPPSVPAAPSFFPYHHHQHMIPPYFPYPPAPVIQPGPFAPYALPSHLAPGKMGPDASISKLPPIGEDPF